ncbi:39S ribosomal protein L17, mitochondrial [Athalia rosae]|uniref:39S ribosomal protein L17, mitochondrial n=1 Tax=Athalia rosae TaxID=37344 RepID=UPI00062599E2|nr:39S ribosomal protein L17, mitochondrial [Athalia rosae]
MNQANVTKLISKLNIHVPNRSRKLKNPAGGEGRLLKLRKTLTALVKYERIELNFNRAEEARGFIERLISDALRHGPGHNETMEMADYWILEKQYVHKLFKVLVPRYTNFTTSYTAMYNAPRPYPGEYYKKSVLELKGNVYPSLHQAYPQKRNLIHNILLEEARKEFRLKKYNEIVNNFEQ